MTSCRGGSLVWAVASHTVARTAVQKFDPLFGGDVLLGSARVQETIVFLDCARKDGTDFRAAVLGSRRPIAPRSHARTTGQREGHLAIVVPRGRLSAIEEVERSAGRSRRALRDREFVALVLGVSIRLRARGRAPRKRRLGWASARSSRWARSAAGGAGGWWPAGSPRPAPRWRRSGGGSPRR